MYYYQTLIQQSLDSGMSTHELAKAIGIPQSSVRNCRTSNVPREKNLLLLAKYYAEPLPALLATDTTTAKLIKKIHKLSDKGKTSLLEKL